MKKIKYGCEATFATCLITETTPNSQSSLISENCLDQEQVNGDIYQQLENIQSQSELSELGNSCMEYVETDGELFVKSVLLKMEQEICTLKTEVETLKSTTVCDMDISSCELELGGLVDSCGQQPQTLKDLLQILINQHTTL